MKKQHLLTLCYRLITLTVFLGVWELAARAYHSDLLLPPPGKAGVALAKAIVDPAILKNLLLTLRRVLTGFSLALLIGLPLGFLMGFSRVAFQLLDPLLNGIRQVPMMAWVPLTIVWFGLGDGPTIFLITAVGVFPILLNTIAAVQAIPRDYLNAARSLGARPASIFTRVIVPASLPGIFTGMRLSLGLGWMSVICAEFIATSAGFGFALVEAQTRMETDTLLALMILGAGVGYGIDRSLRLADSRFGRWRPAH